jgi:hypothetical protein
MIVWVDDVRPGPKGAKVAKSVNEAKFVIQAIEKTNAAFKGRSANKDCTHCKFYADSECIDCEDCQEREAKSRKEMEDLIQKWTIDYIDIDHDAGDYAEDGGDYIKLLDWLEQSGRNYAIRIHSMNPVGAQNMRTIIQKNGWTEIK